MIPTPEMAYAEFVGNRLLVAVLGGARVLAIAKKILAAVLICCADLLKQHLTATPLSAGQRGREDGGSERDR